METSFRKSVPRVRASMGSDDLALLRRTDERKRNNILLMNSESRKIYYLILSLLFFGLCFLIVLFSHELGTARGFTWDVVIIMLLYSVLQLCVPLKPRVWALLVLILAYSVEILQYFHLIEKLSLEGNIFAELILGSVFDPLDLLAYTIGSVLIFLLDSYFSPRNNLQSTI